MVRHHKIPKIRNRADRGQPRGEAFVIVFPAINIGNIKRAKNRRAAKNRAEDAVIQRKQVGNVPKRRHQELLPEADLTRRADGPLLDMLQHIGKWTLPHHQPRQEPFGEEHASR